MLCPPYYTFPLSLTPDSVLCFGRFRAGGSHEVRAQGSYQTANPFGSRMDDPKHSLRCCNGNETFSHPIWRCQSTAPDREHLLQGISDVDPVLRPYRYILEWTRLKPIRDTKREPDRGWTSILSILPVGMSWYKCLQSDLVTLG